MGVHEIKEIDKAVDRVQKTRTGYVWCATTLSKHIGWISLSQRKPSTALAGNAEAYIGFEDLLDDLEAWLKGEALSGCPPAPIV